VVLDADRRNRYFETTDRETRRRCSSGSPKVDTARAADRTSTGLGLSITKAIVERQGGTIGVTSQAGQTTFTVVLPQSAGAG
jgi:signal transduction histidine kinase